MNDTDERPPHRPEAERALLGAIIIDNEAIDRVSWLAASDFFSLHHAKVFRHALALRAAHRPIDLVHLRDALERAGELEDVGLGYLSALIDGVPRAVNAEHYAELVKRDAGARRLIAYCRQAIAAFSGDPDALANGAGERFARAVSELVETAHTDTRPPLTVLSEDRLATQPRPVYAIDDLIPGGDAITLVAAPPNVGKTTLTIAAGISKATGRVFLGRHVPDPGPVLLVFGEGAPAAHSRICAGKIAAGLDPNAAVGLSVIPHAVNFFEAGVDYRAYRELVASLKPALAIIDTFGLCSIGADENSAADVTRTFANIRRTGVPTIINHHLDKRGTAERGSSAFRANCDALLTLLDTDDQLTLACEKMRDGARFDPLRLALFEVPSTGACSVRLANDHMPTGALSPAQQQALNGLIAAFPTGGATRAEWHALVPTLKERTFYHAVGRLHARGFVTERAGRFTPSGRTE